MKLFSYFTLKMEVIINLPNPLEYVIQEIQNTFESHTEFFLEHGYEPSLLSVV
jgi:hypothetical protein